MPFALALSLFSGWLEFVFVLGDVATDLTRILVELGSDNCCGLFVAVATVAYAPTLGPLAPTTGFLA